MNSDEGEYRGWRLVWTGWKESIEHVTRAAQWVACSPGNKYFYYASCPGSEGYLLNGSCCDIALDSRYPEQAICVDPSIPSSDHRFEEAKQKTLLRLKAMIDEVENDAAV